MFRDSRTIRFILSSTAFDNAIAESGRRQTFVIGSTVIMFRRLAHVLTILLIGSIPTVVVTIANKIQWYAHFTGASKFVYAAFLIGAAIVLVRRVTSTTIVIRVTLPSFRDATTSLTTRELIRVARRILAQ
jgi:hypothetical protein